MFSPSSLVLVIVLISYQDSITGVPKPQLFPNMQQPTLNGTSIVESVMEFLRKNVQNSGLDPIKFPPMSFPYENKTVNIKNGRLHGLSKFKQVGDTLITTSLFDLILRTAFGFENLSTDSNVDIEGGSVEYKDGRLQTFVDNLTLLQVYKFSFLTQLFTLDVFEVSMENINVTSDGLGDEVQEDIELATEMANKNKEPILLVFNTVVKGLINAALLAFRSGAVG